MRHQRAPLLTLHQQPRAQQCTLRVSCPWPMSKEHVRSCENNLRSTFAATASSQTSAPFTYVDVRLHLHKSFDTCRLVVLSSKMHCSPSVTDDARQHAFQRAQQEHSLEASVDVCALTDQRFDHGHLPSGSCIVKGRGAKPAAACVKSCAHSKCGISARPRSLCTSSLEHSKALAASQVNGPFQRSITESVPAKQLEVDFCSHSKQPNKRTLQAC
jgi:hypothetical protein